MIIKWKDNVVKTKKKKLRYQENIRIATQYKNWLIIVLNTKLIFHGDEDVSLLLPEVEHICNSKEDGIFYQEKDKNEIYRISDPLEKKTYVCYYPSFTMIGIVFGFLVLKNKNLYILKEIKNSQNNKNFIIEVKDCGNIYIREFNIENLNSIEDDAQNNNNLTQIFYSNYLILVINNQYIFIDITILRTVKETVKRSRLSFYQKVDMKETYKFHRIIRMKLNDKKYLEFLLINESVLIYKTSMISDYFKLEQVTYHTNYYKPFWKFDNEFVKAFLKISDDNFLISFLRNVFSNLEKYHPKVIKKACIKINGYDVLKKILMNSYLNENFKKLISFTVENELLNSENIKTFIEDKNEIIEFFDKSLYLKCEKLYGLIDQLEYLYQNKVDPFSIKYKRIFNFDQKFLDSRNLAYYIISLEKTPENKYYVFKDPFYYIKKRKYAKLMKKALKKLLGDIRANEVLKLMDRNEIGVFEFDENDLEKKRESAFMIRLSCSIGNSFLLFSTGTVEEFYEVPDLKFLVKRKETIDSSPVPVKGWSNWPEFHYSCSYFLSLALTDEISVNHLEVKINDKNKKNDMGLAGMIFAFGLQGRLHNITDFQLMSFLNRSSIVTMASIVSVCISKRGVCEDSISKIVRFNLEKDQSIEVKIGCVLGLGFLHMGSSNLHIANLIMKECNKKGLYESKLHNKGNKVWYDEIYRIAQLFLYHLFLLIRKLKMNIFI